MASALFLEKRVPVMINAAWFMAYLVSASALVLCKLYSIQGTFERPSCLEYKILIGRGSRNPHTIASSPLKEPIPAPILQVSHRSIQLVFFGGGRDQMHWHAVVEAINP
ncbi:hypothetical protein BC939DRAFT_464503 [Gamsiella multidivaricata]|uniref:uncharacterized protein n=1 Tax=Gamsiella multidivaricata TaxID=101098 RepID=UPI00221F6993|nr:uncharacterized protein BC939DRAFT_464503 [Gamsiella multidivaricata]KAI7817923.1 hypothetical protein BC939DRAFT_464503 [Gamsiella multidivaricata]